MGKKILTWIETHWIATTVMTMAIVGAIVMTPILTSRWILDGKVKQYQNLLKTEESAEETTQKEQFEIEIMENPEDYKIVTKYKKPMKNWTKSEKTEFLEKVEELQQAQEGARKIENFVRSGLEDNQNSEIE